MKVENLVFYQYPFTYNLKLKFFSGGRDYSMSAEFKQVKFRNSFQKWPFPMCRWPYWLQMFHFLLCKVWFNINKVIRLFLSASTKKNHTYGARSTWALSLNLLRLLAVGIVYYYGKANFPKISRWYPMAWSCTHQFPNMIKLLARCTMLYTMQDEVLQLQCSRDWFLFCYYLLAYYAMACSIWKFGILQMSRPLNTFTSHL